MRCTEKVSLKYNVTVRSKRSLFAIAISGIGRELSAIIPENNEI
jgi:hypothetical protein